MKNNLLKWKIIFWWILIFIAIISIIFSNIFNKIFFEWISIILFFIGIFWLIIFLVWAFEFIWQIFFKHNNDSFEEYEAKIEKLFDNEIDFQKFLENNDEIRHLFKNDPEFQELVFLSRDIENKWKIEHKDRYKKFLNKIKNKEKVTSKSANLKELIIDYYKSNR